MYERNPNFVYMDHGVLLLSVRTSKYIFIFLFSCRFSLHTSHTAGRSAPRPPGSTRAGSAISLFPPDTTHDDIPYRGDDGEKLNW